MTVRPARAVTKRGRATRGPMHVQHQDDTKFRLHSQHKDTAVGLLQSNLLFSPAEGCDNAMEGEAAASPGLWRGVVRRAPASSVVHSTVGQAARLSQWRWGQGMRRRAHVIPDGVVYADHAKV